MNASNSDREYPVEISTAVPSWDELKKFRSFASVRDSLIPTQDDFCNRSRVWNAVTFILKRDANLLRRLAE